MAHLVAYSPRLLCAAIAANDAPALAAQVAALCRQAEAEAVSELDWAALALASFRICQTVGLASSLVAISDADHFIQVFVELLALRGAIAADQALGLLKYRLTRFPASRRLLGAWAVRFARTYVFSARRKLGRRTPEESFFCEFLLSESRSPFGGCLSQENYDAVVAALLVQPALKHVALALLDAPDPA